MLKIERLGSHHDRKEFDCGNKYLNEFLQKYASQHAQRGISRTFVLVDENAPQTIIGYFTLTVCEVVPATIPDPRLRRYPNPLPAVKLVRIAVSVKHQRNGFGEKLLINAMERSTRIADNAGLVGMFVDAKDDKAAGYYLKYGFTPIENDSLILFLPISTICQAFESGGIKGADTYIL